MKTVPSSKVRVVHGGVLPERGSEEPAFRPKLFLSDGRRYTYRKNFCSRVVALREAQKVVGTNVSELSDDWIEWKD